ncbi:MAG: hypothetical protein E2O84_05785 [Bacteroidetes bacterium]|nr:MAG: hypothetical protein E2O84_05785 [Bacteroidota bacterium]
MIRLLRGILYGIAAGITTAVILDHLDQARKVSESNPAFVLGRHPENTSKSRRQAKQLDQTGADLTDEARQALLDELGAQLQ